MRNPAVMLLWVILPACAANASTVRLSNEHLKDSYDRTESVVLDVTNNQARAISFYSNAEILDNGEWTAWPYEIESGTPEGVSTIHHLKAHETAKIALNFLAISPPPIPSGVTPRCERTPYFRFRIVVEGKVRKELFSNPFKVVDPYGVCSEDGIFKPKGSP